MKLKPGISWFLLGIAFATAGMAVAEPEEEYALPEEAEVGAAEPDDFDYSDLLIGRSGLETKRKWKELESYYISPIYFRIHEGQAYDLRPVVALYRGELKTSSPELTSLFLKWKQVRGKVISTIDGGVIVYDRFDQTAFLEMPSSLSEVYVDGKNVNAVAAKVGIYQYTSVTGALRTVDRYAYGQLDHAAYDAAVEKVDRAVAKREQRIKEAHAEAAAQKQNRLNEADRKALEFQIKRAESGSASAQYDLALRYLEGKGVEVDTAKARLWLQKSAAQDYGPAKKKLLELEPVPDAK